MPVGVFVLGMHRSGTSAVARLVNLLGVPTAADPPAPRRDNPTGFWESASLVGLNTRVLEAVGSETGCPAELAPGWEHDARLSGLRREGEEAFRRVFPAPPWVWKDPRNCLTLPFWSSVLDVEPVVVLVRRNPLEIAQSLQARSGEPKVFALALWERYERQALAASEGRPAFVTSFERVLAEPLELSAELHEFLAANGVRGRRRDAAAILGFVDRQLRHATRTAVDFVDDPAVSDPQRALYAALEALDGPHEALRLPALPPETPTTDALFAERRATVSARQQLRRLQQGHSRSQPTRAARYLSRGRALAVSMLLQLRGG